jgi:hypothetical protein
MENVKVVGTSARVDFPELGMFNVLAKIDTGALSGAVHATNIQITTDKTGKEVLSFCPFGSDKCIEKQDFIKKPIRSSNGQVEKRYIVSTNIIVNGETYPIMISLTDRSQMRKSALIGRRFLRQNHFVVDLNYRGTYGSKEKK